MSGISGGAFKDLGTTVAQQAGMEVLSKALEKGAVTTVTRKAIPFFLSFLLTAEEESKKNLEGYEEMDDLFKFFEFGRGRELHGPVVGYANAFDMKHDRIPLDRQVYNRALGEDLAEEGSEEYFGQLERLRDEKRDREGYIQQHVRTAKDQLAHFSRNPKKLEGGPGSWEGDWDPEFEETWYWEGDNYPATDVAYETYSYTDESGAYDWEKDDDIIYEDYSYP
jgi:hypothetical protein